MIVTAWFGAVVLLTWLFAGVLDRQYNPNQSVYTERAGDTVAVTLLRNRLGHYVANGRINGRNVRFILDTGATYVALGDGLAQELGLHRGRPSQTLTANGTIVTYRTMLDEVELGGIEIRDVAASINPHMSEDTVLLGMSFLKHLELIQRGDHLLLRQLRPAGRGI